MATGDWRLKTGDWRLETDLPQHAIHIRISHAALESRIRSPAFQLRRDPLHQPQRRPHRARTDGHPRHAQLLQLGRARRSWNGQNVHWTLHILDNLSNTL